MLYIIYGRKILHSYELYDSFDLAKIKHKSLPTPGKFVRRNRIAIRPSIPSFPLNT